MSGRVWLAGVLIALGLSLPGCGKPMAQKKERGPLQRGQVYVQMGRYRDAIDSFRKAVELDPDAVEQPPTIRRSITIWAWPIGRMEKRTWRRGN